MNTTKIKPKKLLWQQKCNALTQEETRGATVRNLTGQEAQWWTAG